MLGLTDLFRHFITTRAENDPTLKEIIDEADKARLEAEKKNTHRRKTEKEEDADLLEEEVALDNGSESSSVYTSSPVFINGKMRDYQIQGLNWMISLYENSISGILADEMGLGKTLQTISFLGHLRYGKGINGPHLVVVPKSTLNNWVREFENWTPEVDTCLLHGDKETRANIIQTRIIPCDFDVLITSYEMILKEKSTLIRFAWQYIVIDEAHRIKNESTALAKVLRLFHTRNSLLITGTPLQNNIHELWALLNFLLPDVFSSSEDFDLWFENQGGDQDRVVKQLHKVLEPFLLRRVKADVEKSLLPKKEINIYVGLSEMQLLWYKKILEKDIDAVNGASKEKTRLLNVVMQLRKCCNHPYLFEGAEPGPPYSTDVHLIDNSGKMVILDKLLRRAKKNGSRVLIFSQMTRVLDILEDYCMFRSFKYCRIDGQTQHVERVAYIDDFNRENSDKFVFLLTTRAGGLGINLTTADTVVIFDSDWNPQMDLQAMDRAHRIGQTKQVYVYRLITENTIEEKVLERAAHKLRLDQLVIQEGRARPQTTNAASKQDLLSMIQHGAQDVLSSSNRITDVNSEDIDEILAKGEQKTRELNSKYEKYGLDDLQNYSSESAYQWNGQDFRDINKQKKDSFQWISLAKRERKENYNVDGYYREVLSNKSGTPGSENKPVAPKAPKQLNIYDHQFFPSRLTELYDKETAYYRQQVKYVIPISDDATEEEISEIQEQQKLIDNAVSLSEKEEEEKKNLETSGFRDWSRRDFFQFINASAKFGRKAIANIAKAFNGDKTQSQVSGYAKTFWDKYELINGWEKYVGQIEAGEEKNKKIVLQKSVLKKKVNSFQAPLQQMVISYPPSAAKKTFSEEEDRFILVQMNKLGLDTESLYEQIRDTIRASPLFKFDWFFLSRTPIELGRRGTTLIMYIMKEHELSSSSRKRKASSNDSSRKKSKS